MFIKVIVKIISDLTTEIKIKKLQKPN